MKHAGWMVVVALAGSAAAAGAQNPPPGPPMGDSMRRPMAGMMMRQGGNPEQLRQEVEARWGQMVQTELGLNDQQMERVRTAQRANQDRHTELNRREQDLHRAVQTQLQPGVAANNDSLSRSLEALALIRVQHAQSDQTLLRDLAFLTPVQRARYFFMAQRFKQRVDQIRGRAQPGMMQPQGPGMPRRPAGMVRRPGAEEEM